MKPDILHKWTRALRSGEYKKCIGALKKTRGKKETFCALGVLCDVYAKEKNVSWYSGPDGIEILGSLGDLPYEVQEWAGLESEDPVICTKNGDEKCVAEVNDHEKKSFNVMADMIEDAAHDKLL